VEPTISAELCRKCNDLIKEREGKRPLGSKPTHPFASHLSRGYRLRHELPVQRMRAMGFAVCVSERYSSRWRQRIRFKLRLPQVQAAASDREGQAIAIPP
jgi:hypothetical protein